MRTAGFILGFSVISAGILSGFQLGQRNEGSFADELSNIIIIYTDDQGYCDVGAYGASSLKIPNIDKLAEGGVRFTNDYASSATCTPRMYEAGLVRRLSTRTFASKQYLWPIPTSEILINPNLVQNLCY